MARTVKDVIGHTNLQRELSVREHQFEAVCDVNRKLLAACRLVYAELQRTDPDVVTCRRYLGDAYPGGITALIKGSNGQCGRQNGS